MTELNFRLIHIVNPETDNEIILSQLQKNVEECGLTVLSIQRLELGKLSYPPYTGMLEFIADVRATWNDGYDYKKKFPLYEKLCRSWINKACNILGERPLLQLFNDECFGRKRNSFNKIGGDIIFSFGVCPKLGKYVCYHRIRTYWGLTFYHDTREVDIVISNEIEDDFFDFEITKYAIIPYKSINSVIVDFRERSCFIYLSLQHPPLFYERTIRELFEYQQTFHERIMPFHISSEIASKANVICFHIEHDYDYQILISSLRKRCDRMPIHFVSMETVSDVPPSYPYLMFPDFECAYLWQAIAKRNYTMLAQSSNINRDAGKLLRYSESDAKCLELSLKALLPIIESGKFVNYWHALDMLYSTYVHRKTLGNHHDYVVPAKCRLIRRVTVTPSRILLWPADLMHENRVLRNFESDFYLRVTIRDEDLMTMNVRRYSGPVFDEAFRSILSGVVIGSRHYELLGWSSSQLREHGVSMYAKDSLNRTAASIRKWTEIDPYTDMNIPKCLARMGQCFSQTDETVYVPLDDLHVNFEKDIERGYNASTNKPYCFSDGVGKISRGLAEEVIKSLRHAEGSSAFQIRYGGCKGMLVIDPNLQGKRIVFRESMQKFRCRGIQHAKLEVAKKSAPISLRLNRPLIAILNDLGVKQVVFLKLQENMLQNLLDMLLNEEEAARYLKMRTPFSVFHVEDLSRSGVGLTVEPFFRTLLLALHRYYVDLIKTKANIEIDPAYARNMFGVLDETGILEYGQVFVQYTTDISEGKSIPGETKILRCPVMVTKCPCVHPGDVRIFNAIDVPKLHHIVDCIVFPQKGPRPHPDEMAGSDLDGDEYAVIWMKDLMFEGYNREAPDYPKPRTNKYQNVSSFLLHSETREVSDFLRNYIIGDQIGNIASVHLSQADQLGIDDEVCISIAMKHSVAVDFSKTGVSASLERGERPRKYPDFMERFWQRKYKSRKSLGKMYRISKDFENVSEAVRVHYRGIKVDPLLVVNGWQEFEMSATASRNEYNSTLKNILQTYGIAHETEAFGGAFIKIHPRFRERRDRAEIVSLVLMWLKQLVDKTKEHFFIEFKSSGSLESINKKVLCKASAWYVVTYRDKDPEFLSFPWVISDILSNIRIQNQFEEKVDRFPLVSRIEEIILIIERSGEIHGLTPYAHTFLQRFYYICQRIIVERAVAILTKWGEDEKIISSSNEKGEYLYYDVFLKLILYVAEHEGYVSKVRCPPTGLEMNYSSSILCLAFLKYCMKLRFLKKEELERVLPFYVFKARLLAKRALVAYHTIAVTGTFSTVQSEACGEESVSMEPMSIDVEVLGVSPLEESKLRNAESVLVEMTDAEYVEMRECLQKKKIIVSAEGTKQSIRNLQDILRKNMESLGKLFSD